MHYMHTRSVSILVQSWETKDKYFLPTPAFSYRSLLTHGHSLLKHIHTHTHKKKKKKSTLYCDECNVMLISETCYSAVDRRGGGPDVGLSWTIRKNSEEVGYFGFMKMCVTLVATLHATVI